MAFVSWGWHLARMHQIKNSPGETDHRTCKTRAPLTSSVALLVYITYLQITSSSKWFVALSTLSLKAAFSITFPFSRSWKHFISIVSLLLSHFYDSVRFKGSCRCLLEKSDGFINLLSFAKRYIATHTVGLVSRNHFWELESLSPMPCMLPPTRALLSGVKDAFFWCNTHECILDYKWEKQQCSIWFKSRIRQM